MFSSGAMKSKVDLLEASRMLFNQGYKIYATAGTAAFLNAHGVDTTPVYWPDEKPGAENNVMKMIADHKFDLIVNIPKNHSKRELTNGYRHRRGAIDHNIPLTLMLVWQVRYRGILRSETGRYSDKELAGI